MQAYAEVVPHPEGYHHTRNPKKYHRKSRGSRPIQGISKNTSREGSVSIFRFLGLREFIPDYLGVPRDNTQRERSITIPIPSMLFTVYQGHKGHVDAVYSQVSRSKKEC